MHKILLIYTPGDIHGEAVRWALGTRDIGCDVWHLSDFPGKRSASVYLAQDGSLQGQFGDLPASRRLDQYDLIWMRRRGQPTIASDLHPADRSFAKQETSLFLRNLRALLGHAGTRWINDPKAAIQADYKLHQLQVARRCGFDIPATLVTNDPDAVAAFAATHGPSLVSKNFGGCVWRNEQSGASSYSLTAELSPEHLANRRAIEVAPAIYQPRVDVAYELRVTAFGSTVLAARIDSQAEGRRTDWRHEVNYRGMPIRLTELPSEVANRCLALLEALDLKFGCLDLIVTRDGRYVFIEVNEAGQFLWVEQRDSNVPVLREFSRYLASLVGVEDNFEGITLAAFQTSEACARAEEMLLANPNALKIPESVE